MKTRLLLLATLLTPVSACDCHEYVIAAVHAGVRVIAASTCPDQSASKSTPAAPAKPAPTPKPPPSKERTPRPPRPEYLFM